MGCIRSGTVESKRTKNIYNSNKRVLQVLILMKRGANYDKSNRVVIINTANTTVEEIGKAKD